MFFDDWGVLGRTVVATTLGYLALLVAVRVGGKRILSQLNAFDFIVTVAFGSTLATLALSRDVAIAEGVLAFALLVALQYTISQLSVRVPRFQKLVKARPVALVANGELRDDAMRHMRVSEVEIYQALRSSGVGSPRDVAAVVLETNGKLSVIRELLDDEALSNVEGWPA